MRITIHRGTNEIGGSCVELSTDRTRILLDFGMPLVDSQGKEFSFKKYESLNTKELIEKSILPDIKGLYELANNNIDAVLLSHPHADHYGFLNYIGDHVKVYLGEATKDIIELSNIFTPMDILLKNHRIFVNDVAIEVGDFRITPIWVDHSAYDSYMFLIEADGKRVLYSGDFRLHGRKSKMMEKLLIKPPENIDYLILEGTNISDSEKSNQTEELIENNLTELFSENKPYLVYVSGQNIDRLVSIYKASLRSGKTLVVDVYVAKILKTLSKYNKFPYPNDSYDLKVLFTKYTCDRIARIDRKDILYEFAKYKIKKDDIANKPSDYVILVRPSHIIDIKRIDNLNNGNFIYSLWEGYKTKPDTMKLLDWVQQRNFILHDIHSRGHADILSLKRFVNAINPKNIIPIHTFQKEKYSSIFSHNVINLNDGEKFYINRK
jgi:ribonuclease J